MGRNEHEIVRSYSFTANENIHVYVQVFMYYK